MKENKIEWDLPKNYVSIRWFIFFIMAPKRANYYLRFFFFVLRYDLYMFVYFLFMINRYRLKTFVLRVRVCLCFGLPIRNSQMNFLLFTHNRQYGICVRFGCRYIFKHYMRLWCMRDDAWMLVNILVRFCCANCTRIWGKKTISFLACFIDF